ncbi:type IV pilus biogenesis/stability protein PilW [Vreelandella nanhaiensis]|uniref:Type IV pilus biogenesis/stability protein PilW n=1 Tax=Vreelandella nanhaiensis TaxID=1258546 RepID=A0A3S0WCF3_9GAMM|nr:type IV pilus biogenesis/stability protein PilW [Halomonas nanhaiensis]RUR34524.1 type IV pilus biogenesis/stability protein PilW [Halomonas nanhaiensis]
MICHCRRFNPFRVPMLAVLFSSVWLAGCATSSSSPTQANNDARDAYTQLGVAYLEQANLPRARSALERALKVDPRHAQALQAMALVYQQQGDVELAETYFQQAIDAEPTFTRARNNYAAFLYQQGQIEAACKQLESAAEDPQYASRAQLFTNLGQCYLALEEFDKARGHLIRAQRIDPRHTPGYLTLAELEVLQGNYMDASPPLHTYLQLAGPDRAVLELAIDIARAEGDDATAADYQRQLGTY